MLTNLNTGSLDQLLIPLLGDLYSWGKSYLQRMTNPGMYEVLNYETTLEILDNKGEKAMLNKKEEVKFLQNNIIAYQDQAWGDGKILLDYKCSPGTPVDRYRSGYKTHILISLREVKNKGDIDEFNIEWGIENGFLSKTGFWATEICQNTKRIVIQVIFPKTRPPIRALILEKNIQRTYPLDGIDKKELPDGRWLVSWEKNQPRLYEHYILNWEW
jgi:hypothetical protein